MVQCRNTKEYAICADKFGNGEVSVVYSRTSTLSSLHEELKLIPPLDVPRVTAMKYNGQSDWAEFFPTFHLLYDSCPLYQEGWVSSPSA